MLARDPEQGKGPSSSPMAGMPAICLFVIVVFVISNFKQERDEDSWERS